MLYTYIYWLCSSPSRYSIVRTPAPASPSSQLFACCVRNDCSEHFVEAHDALRLCLEVSRRCSGRSFAEFCDALRGNIADFIALFLERPLHSRLRMVASRCVDEYFRDDVPLREGIVAVMLSASEYILNDFADASSISFRPAHRIPRRSCAAIWLRLRASLLRCHTPVSRRTAVLLLSLPTVPRHGLFAPLPSLSPDFPLCTGSAAA